MKEKMSGVQFTVSEARPGWRPQGSTRTEIATKLPQHVEVRLQLGTVGLEPLVGNSSILRPLRETLGLWILTRTNSTCWPLLVTMEWLLSGTPERRKPPCIVVCSTTTGSG